MGDKLKIISFNCGNLDGMGKIEDKELQKFLVDFIVDGWKPDVVLLQEIIWDESYCYLFLGYRCLSKFNQVTMLKEDVFQSGLMLLEWKGRLFYIKTKFKDRKIMIYNFHCSFKNFKFRIECLNYIKKGLPYKSWLVIAGGDMNFEIKEGNPLREIEKFRASSNESTTIRDTSIDAIFCSDGDQPAKIIQKLVFDHKNKSFDHLIVSTTIELREETKVEEKKVKQEVVTYKLKDIVEISDKYSIIVDGKHRRLHFNVNGNPYYISPAGNRNFVTDKKEIYEGFDAVDHPLKERK